MEIKEKEQMLFDAGTVFTDADVFTYMCVKFVKKINL